MLAVKMEDIDRELDVVKEWVSSLDHTSKLAVVIKEDMFRWWNKSIDGMNKVLERKQLMTLYTVDQSTYCHAANSF
jgi:hypothetical protein